MIEERGDVHGVEPDHDAVGLDQGHEGGGPSVKGCQDQYHISHITQLSFPQ